jgi:hypothetical protein
MASSGAAKLLKEQFKKLNNPNEKIRKMFEDVDRLNNELQ